MSINIQTEDGNLHRVASMNGTDDALVIDNEFNMESKRAVQNKVISEAVDTLQNNIFILSQNLNGTIKTSAINEVESIADDDLIVLKQGDNLKSIKYSKLVELLDISDKVDVDSIIAAAKSYTDSKVAAITPASIGAYPISEVSNYYVTKRYITTSSSSSNNGKWTKVASIDLHKQFEDSNVLLECLSCELAANSCYAKFWWRVKQQDVLGNPPLLYINMIHCAEGFALTHFKSIITENSTSKTTAELYIYNPKTYNTILFAPIINANGNIIFYSTQPYINDIDLPSGLSITATAIS